MPGHSQARWLDLRLFQQDPQWPGVSRQTLQLLSTAHTPVRWAMPLRRDALDSPTTSSELRSRSRGYLDGLLTPLSGSAKKKRRHPVAKLKGNWQPDEDERLIACVCTSSSQVQRQYRASQLKTPENKA